MAKDPKNVKRGKAAKAAGTRFENKVGNHMRSKGYFVDKWNNNVDLKVDEFDTNYPEGIMEKNGKLIIAKSKFNPFSRAVMVGAGFPDFIAFIKLGSENEYTKTTECGCLGDDVFYFDIHVPTVVIGVEAKMNGYLSAIEKDKCQWLLENGVFNKIFIASKGKKRGSIKYKEFKYD